MSATPLLKLAVCLMVGILTADVFCLPQVPLLAAFVGFALLALAVYRHALAQSVAICMCFVLLGAVLYARQRQRLAVSWPEEDMQFEAVVVSEPQEKPRTVGFDVVVCRLQQTADGKDAVTGRRLKCYVAKDERSRRIAIGDGLLIRSRIRENDDFRIGAFDYRRYLEVHGFTGNTYVPARSWRHGQVSLAGLSRLERVRLVFLKYRHRLLQQFQSRQFGNDVYGVVAAMTLGDKSALTRDMREVYNVSGAAHVLALSGLHLGIVYALLSLLIVGRRLRVAMQVLVVLGMWAFAFLVGLSPSVVRSAVMLSVYALLSLGHRGRMSVNVLCFTAICMLVASPLSLFDVGFQLSFLSVLSIVVFYPLFYGLLSVEFLQGHRVVRWLWGMACVSISAQIGTAPLVAYYFGRFSTAFLLTNFIVVPATTLVLYLSLLVLLLPFVGRLLAIVVHGMNVLLAGIAAWPVASIDNLHPTRLQVVMLYVFIVAFWLLLKRQRCTP